MKSRDSGFEIRNERSRPDQRLDVWQDAMTSVEAVYRFSKTAPRLNASR